MHENINENLDATHLKHSNLQLHSFVKHSFFIS